MKTSLSVLKGHMNTVKVMLLFFSMLTFSSAAFSCLPSCEGWVVDDNALPPDPGVTCSLKAESTTESNMVTVQLSIELAETTDTTNCGVAVGLPVNSPLKLTEVDITQGGDTIVVQVETPEEPDDEIFEEDPDLRQNTRNGVPYLPNWEAFSALVNAVNPSDGDIFLELKFENNTNASEVAVAKALAAMFMSFGIFDSDSEGNSFAGNNQVQTRLGIPTTSLTCKKMLKERYCDGLKNPGSGEDEIGHGQCVKLVNDHCSDNNGNGGR